MDVFRTRVMSQLEFTSVTRSSGHSFECWLGSSLSFFHLQSQGVGVGEDRKAQETQEVTRRSLGRVSWLPFLKPAVEGHRGVTTAHGEDSPGPQGIRRLWVRGR